MAPANSDEENLGSKHKQFNKQVLNEITNGKLVGEKEFVIDRNDLDNLMKIDIASHYKDIGYILSVLRSDDMLYVSRAIQQSVWIVDEQYADIINPNYLNEHVFPRMKTKAVNKLLKHIRHYLKQEYRVEEFYKNEIKPKTAALWLSRCSIPFIKSNIEKHMNHVSNLEFKRLCTRSVTIFEAAMENCLDMDKVFAASFLLHTEAEKYLDLFEVVRKRTYCRMRFGAATTELIMKKAPNRIINDFINYIDHLHIPTFIEKIKREQIKGFLLELANKNDENYRFRTVFCFDVIKQFVKRMPKEEQFEFVKKVFLDKENILSISDDTLQRGTEMFAVKYICKICKRTPLYYWYEFASFNIAFDEMKKIIQAETNFSEKNSMFNVLLKCAAENTKNLLALLTYYVNTTRNDNFESKKYFINNLLLQAEIYKRNDETWNTFINVINSTIINTSDDNQEYTQIIILHDAINNKTQVSEEIEKIFLFDTLKRYRKSLNQDEESKVFEYLYNYMTKKVQGDNIQTETEFTEAVQIVQDLLDLLIDWDKDLSDYPFIVNKIQELIRIRKNNAWKINLSSLYNKKKSWRRLMFEESIVLSPSQTVCVNAIKHDPKILARYNADVEDICSDDAISMKQLLRKLRIYWPDTLAANWSKLYFSRIDRLGGHKALARGLCTLLSKELLLDVLNKYAPAQAKIDWNNTNELTLGLQRCFAKNMHISRPQPPADAILMYAKGDFLQYALPSVLAIYYGMSRVESQEHIPKLLNAPVSLQKHGLRLAFIKLKHEELKFHLSNIWQTTKNISIRAVTFVLLFDLLCKETDATRTGELWEILEDFMDNLSFKEDKKIYLKLNKVEDLPAAVRSKFLVKSYKFLKSLLPHLKSDRNDYEYKIKQLAVYTRNIMESVSPEFVENIVTEYLDANFFNSKLYDNDMLGVTSAYLLCAKDEETQIIKYQKILVPLIKRAMLQWNDMHDDKYFIRNNFQDLLSTIYRDLFEYAITNKMIIPLKIFRNIVKELDTLSLPQNYLIIRMWNLVVKLTEIIDKTDNPEDLQAGAEELGKFCLEVLKDDVKTHFPCIYVLFEKVLRKIESVQNILPKNILPITVCLQVYEVLLSDKDFIQAYLLVLRMLTVTGHYSDMSDADKAKEIELKQLIQSHSSVEVRMHYYCLFSDDETESLGI